MSKYQMVIKTRDDSGQVQIRRDQAKALLESGNKDSAWKIFQTIAEGSYDPITDQTFLTLIINWVPEKGRSVMETARWIDFALKVDKLKVGDTLQITEKEMAMLLERLRDEDFKLNLVTTSFYEFLQDFQTLCGEPIYQEKSKETKE